MTNIRKDRLFLEKGISELPAFLLSKTLYWPISVPGRDLPRLTIGSLLLSKLRLATLASTIEEQSEMVKIEREIETIRSKRQSAWEIKCGQEFYSRIGLWESFLIDYGEARDFQIGQYGYEVRLRVMLELIMAELSTPPEESSVLIRLDGKLRAIFEPGDFIWDDDLKPGFPVDTFWFLYGRLKS